MSEENEHDELSKYWVETYFDKGIDLYNRRIWLNDDVEEESTFLVISGMQLLDTLSKDPIKLFISSYGGDYYGMLSIIDMMQLMESEVHTVATGKCMSAATAILAAGTPGHRCATKSTSFMVHEGHVYLEGATRRNDTKSTYKELDRLQDIWAAYLEEFTSKRKKWWLDLNSKVEDTYWSAAQAKRFGLIDRIL